MSRVATATRQDTVSVTAWADIIYAPTQRPRVRLSSGQHMTWIWTATAACASYQHSTSMHGQQMRPRAALQSAQQRRLQSAAILCRVAPALRWRLEARSKHTAVLACARMEPSGSCRRWVGCAGAGGCALSCCCTNSLCGGSLCSAWTMARSAP